MQLNIITFPLMVAAAVNARPYVLERIGTHVRASTYRYAYILINNPLTCSNVGRVRRLEPGSAKKPTFSVFSTPRRKRSAISYVSTVRTIHLESYLDPSVNPSNGPGPGFRLFSGESISRGNFTYRGEGNERNRFVRERSRED